MNALERVTYRSQCGACHTDLDVWGWDVGVPGLVIQPGHQHCGPSGEVWHVVHFRSAAAVLVGFGCPEPAFAAAWQLAGLMDWTLSGDEVVQSTTTEVKQRLRSILDQYQLRATSRFDDVHDRNPPPREGVPVDV